MIFLGDYLVVVDIRACWIIFFNSKIIGCML